MKDSRSVSTAEEGSGCGEVSLAGSSHTSDADKASLGSMDQEKLKRSHHVFSQHLELVEALITTSHVEPEELEEGQLVVDSFKEALGPRLGEISPRPVKEVQLGEDGLCETIVPLTAGGSQNSSQLLKASVAVGIPNSTASAIAPTFNLPPDNRPLLKSSFPFRHPGDFVGKLSLREAKRMARLKIASMQSSSSSLMKKADVTSAASPRSPGRLARDLSRSGSIALTSSSSSRKGKAALLGSFVSF